MVYGRGFSNNRLWYTNVALLDEHGFSWPRVYKLDYCFGSALTNIDFPNLGSRLLTVNFFFNIGSDPAIGRGSLSPNY